MATKICSSCNQEKQVSEFFKQSRMRDGLQSQCKECANKSYKVSRSKKKDAYNKVRRDRVNRNRKLITEWKEKKGCFVCAESFGPCLELHHLDSTNKNADPSDLVLISVDSFLKEAEKCIVLCANCHRKLHHGAIVI